MVKYWADIDGLRALSVLAVILFHYGVSEASGGFVGVDVFFVISGYLITRLLADQIAGPGLSLMDFYNRRIRRILPALLLIILVTLVAGWFLLLPQDYADLGRSAAYSSVGLGNFYFFKNTGYFDRAAELRPCSICGRSGSKSNSTWSGRPHLPSFSGPPESAAR